MAITCDVCGGELIIGAGGTNAKCTVCGVAYSIERIREKLKNGATENKEKKCADYEIVDFEIIEEEVGVGDDIFSEDSEEVSKDDIFYKRGFSNASNTTNGGQLICGRMT